MTDKEKICEEVKRKLDVMQYQVHRKDAYKELKSILDYIDSLQEEPVSEDFTKALAECIHKAQCSVVDPLAHAEVWKEELVKLVKCEEPVSEELEEAATQYGIDNFPSLCNGCKRVPVDAFKSGAKWQKAKDQKRIDDNRQQIFDEGYKNGSYAGRYDMYNRLFEAAATDRVVTHFLLAHSV